MLANLEPVMSDKWCTAAAEADASLLPVLTTETHRPHRADPQNEGGNKQTPIRSQSLSLAQTSPGQQTSALICRYCENESERTRTVSLS